MRKMFGGDNFDYVRQQDLQRSRLITDTIEAVVTIILDTFKTAADDYDWFGGIPPLLVPAVERARALDNLIEYDTNCFKCGAATIVEDLSSAKLQCDRMLLIFKRKMITAGFETLPSVETLSKEVADELTFLAVSRCEVCGYELTSMTLLTE